MQTIKKFKSPLSQYLHEIFERRRNRNRRYSLRAFARDMNVNPGRLSEIFSLKYAPGHQVAEKMVAALKLDGSECDRFWGVLQAHNTLFRETCGARVLTEAAAEIIVDFDHYSLMNLMGTDDYCADPKWAADRLGISSKKVIEMLDRLILFGLIKMDSSSRYVMTDGKLTTTQDIPSQCLKEAHKRLLLHALDSLENIPVEFRDITSITFALDRKNLSEAKDLIRDFRRRMAALSESGLKNEVYNLNIQLVPVTKVEV